MLHLLGEFKYPLDRYRNELQSPDDAGTLVWLDSMYRYCSTYCRYLHMADMNFDVSGDSSSAGKNYPSVLRICRHNHSLFHFCPSSRSAIPYKFKVPSTGTKRFTQDRAVVGLELNRLASGEMMSSEWCGAFQPHQEDGKHNDPRRNLSLSLLPSATHTAPRPGHNCLHIYWIIKSRKHVK